LCERERVFFQERAESIREEGEVVRIGKGDFMQEKILRPSRFIGEKGDDIRRKGDKSYGTEVTFARGGR